MNKPHGSASRRQVGPGGSAAPHFNKHACAKECLAPDGHICGTCSRSIACRLYNTRFHQDARPCSPPCNRASIFPPSLSNIQFPTSSKQQYHWQKQDRSWNSMKAPCRLRCHSDRRAHPLARPLRHLEDGARATLTEGFSFIELDAGRLYLQGQQQDVRKLTSFQQSTSPASPCQWQSCGCLPPTSRSPLRLRSSSI